MTSGKSPQPRSGLGASTESLFRFRDAEDRPLDAEDHQPDAEDHRPGAEDHRPDAEDHQPDAEDHQPDAPFRSRDAEDRAPDALLRSRDAEDRAHDAVDRAADAWKSASEALRAARFPPDRDPDPRNLAPETQNGAVPTSSTAPFTFQTSPYAATMRGADRGGGTATAGEGALGSVTWAAIAEPAAAIINVTTITVIPSAPSRTLKSSRMRFRRLRTASALIPTSAAVSW